MSDKMREALKRLADACDVVGVKYFDTDTMSDEVQVMQAATRDARAALAEQPAQGDSVPMPQNADQAALMALLGEAWLRNNAPERLKQPAQGEAVAWLDHVEKAIREAVNNAWAGGVASGARVRTTSHIDYAHTAIALLRTAPPAPSVPEARPYPAATAAMSQFNGGWNACRAAMLAAAPEVKP